MSLNVLVGLFFSLPETSFLELSVPLVQSGLTAGPACVLPPLPSMAVCLLLFILHEHTREWLPRKQRPGNHLNPWIPKNVFVFTLNSRFGYRHLGWNLFFSTKILKEVFHWLLDVGITSATSVVMTNTLSVTCCAAWKVLGCFSPWGSRLSHCAFLWVFCHSKGCTLDGFAIWKLWSFSSEKCSFFFFFDNFSFFHFVCFLGLL